MTTRRIVRSAAVAVTVVALALSAIALPAAAKGPKAGRGPKVEHVSKGKSANAKSAAAAKKAAAKARKAARFVATGTVVAVSADSLTVSVAGGSKSLRGTEAVFSVPADVRVNRDDVTVTLADVLVGDHAAVKGSTVDGVLVASKVNAASPEPVEEVTEIVTDEPTETVTDEPTETVTDEPTESVIDEPTEEVTEPALP